MRPDLTPFSTLLTLEDGTLDPERGVIERRLSDMRNFYQTVPAGIGDPLIYRVRLIPVPEENCHIQCSTTVMQPGLVGEEYFMTKGHFHRIRDRSEVYLGLAGTGRLVMATEDGDSHVEPIAPGTVNYVPGGWAHRSVNVGDEPLVFFVTYVADAGYDYATVEEKGFPVLVVRDEDGPQIVDNPAYGGDGS